MFIRTKTHERFIAELKQAFASERSVLAEQIDYLRAQLGYISSAAAHNPAAQPPVSPDLPMHVSEEEQDLRRLEERKMISVDDLEHELARLQLANTTIDIAQ